MTNSMRPSPWGHGAWPALLAIPVLCGAALLAGLFVPVPGLDVVAALISQVVWFIPVVAALTVASVFLWRVRRTSFRAWLAAIASITLLGGIAIVAQSVALAASHRVRIDTGELLFGLSVDNPAPDVTLEYTQHHGEALTLAIWRPSNGAEEAPVLVMTHGGGFVGGSVQEQLVPYARWFANNGFLVIGANYTLSSQSVHAWDVTEGQIACALAWANEYAEEYGGDISRLGMYGESAGGNLVINTAYKAAAGELASSCGGELPRVSAVAALYPVVGIIEAYDNQHMLGDTGRQFDEQYLGGSPQQYPERYASAQSINALNLAAPPTLIVYGASDHLVPPLGTKVFVAAALDAGLDVRAIAIPYGEHGFDLVSGGIGAQVWRQSALQMFDEHLGPDR